ncbi:succinate dehydrogenase, cytochrome b556 subunit [Chloroflexota bacterium]
MSERESKQTYSNWFKWFDVRHREIGDWAFVLHRLTALGLVLYLGMHLIVLGTLTLGPEAFNSFIDLAHNPLFILGELLVVAAALYHGLNGLRVGLTSFGVAIPYQKQIWYVVMAIAVIVSIIFGISMFTA